VKFSPRNVRYNAAAATINRRRYDIYLVFLTLAFGIEVIRPEKTFPQIITAKAPHGKAKNDSLIRISQSGIRGH
jgi:hypothetical protein